jgi:hypothetical protein
MTIPPRSDETGNLRLLNDQIFYPAARMELSFYVGLTDLENEFFPIFFRLSLAVDFHEPIKVMAYFRKNISHDAGEGYGVLPNETFSQFLNLLFVFGDQFQFASSSTADTLRSRHFFLPLTDDGVIGIISVLSIISILKGRRIESFSFGFPGYDVVESERAFS